MTANLSGRKIIFFGCPLDGDERHESIQEKLALIGVKKTVDDPYEGIMEIIRQEIDPGLWSEKGSMDLPSWLRPIPPLTDEDEIKTETFVTFMDSGGFQNYAQKIGELIANSIFPNIPLTGMDVTEINPRRAGENHATGEDRTYRIAANIIQRLLWGVYPSPFQDG